MFLPKLTEEIYCLMRTYPRFWSAKEIAATIDGDQGDIEKTLRHHTDFKRFACVPACERCNPLLNKSQSCRHPGAHYVYKILIKGIGLLNKHEMQNGKPPEPAEKRE